MLDNEMPDQTAAATADPSLPKPPAGRRSRRRPAGPPQPAALTPPEPRAALAGGDGATPDVAVAQAELPVEEPAEVGEHSTPVTEEQPTDNDHAPVAEDSPATVESVPAEQAQELDEIEAAAEHADAVAAAQPDDEAEPEHRERVEGAAAADDSAEPEESEAAESASRRRRRRRGGRRRHASVESSDESEETTEDSEAAGVADEETGGDADESDEDQEQGSESGTSGAARRRRRRRRRRGEDTSTGAEDDPTDVVVKVRESAPAEDQIHAVEGSTRLEAKRQRRREGRAAGRRRAPIVSEAEFLARREAVKRQMVLRQSEDLSQIAVLEDGILVEHYVDRESSSSLIGNIYLGKVQNVLPSMEAAFIDIGRGRNAVLYAGEVDWDSHGAAQSERRIENVLKSGQQILVQVTKDPVGAKGARLTNHVSIPGRYVVYAPGGHLSGISRKLPDVERKRLKHILAELIEEGASVIVRTAAEGATREQLVHDVSRLKSQWEGIEKKAKQGGAPHLVYGEPDLTIRTVRDLFTEDFAELVIDGNGLDNDAYEALTEYLQHVAPHLSERVVHWDRQAKGDVFSHYRLDEQIAKALERKVHLPSGGSLIIDRTEAMTVVDVNTGKFTGHGGNLEATVTANNLEAAEEIVRQLRLRDIGGIIVVDFIDMVLPSNRELLLRRLVECLGRDRTRHQVSEVTSLGLVQMTRKKIGTGLAEAFTEPCEHCNQRGYIVHDMPVATQAPSDGGDRQGRGGRKRGRGRNGDKPAAQPAGSGNGQQSQGRDADKEQLSEEARAAAQAAISAVAHAGAAPRPSEADGAAMLDEVVAALQGSAEVAAADGAQAEQPSEDQPAAEEKPSRSRRSSRSRSRRSTGSEERATDAPEPAAAVADASDAAPGSASTTQDEAVPPEEADTPESSEAATQSVRPARKRATRSGSRTTTGRGSSARSKAAGDTESSVEQQPEKAPGESPEPAQAPATAEQAATEAAEADQTPQQETGPEPAPAEERPDHGHPVASEDIEAALASADEDLPPAEGTPAPDGAGFSEADSDTPDAAPEDMAVAAEDAATPAEESPETGEEGPRPSGEAASDDGQDSSV